MGGYPVGAFFPVRVDGGEVRAQAWGGVTMYGAFGDHPTPVDIVAEISRFEAEWEGHRLESTGPWRYDQHGTALTLRDLTLEGGSTSLRLSGARTAGGAVDFTGGGTVDLDLLRLVVPGLELSEGTATVELSFQGPPKNVDSHVLVQASGARFEGDWFPEELQDVDLSVRASPTRYDLETRGRFGGGVFEVGGTIGAESWTPKRYELSGTATDATLRWFDFLPPARGNAQLTFRGPADSLLLAGHVDVTSMVFSERISWEDWIVELEEGRLQEASSIEVGEPLFAMNVDIVANETIRAQNNVAELDASAELRLVGDTERPGLIGDVRALPGGKVLFKEREFDLERGEIHFLDPYSFDPELDFALVTDVPTREQDYDISLWVNGPFSNWRSTASSDPALSQADINAVLLFGMTGEEFERYGGIATAVALEGLGLAATKVSGDLGLANQTGQGIFQLEALRPDRVDIQTGVGKRSMGSVTTGARLVVEKDVEIEGWPEGTFVIEQNLVDLEDTYLGLEQRLARRLYATGYWATQPIGRDISVLGAFGAEFNVRWEFD
jgi:autotransporter translocation and assembly factor TamB